MSSLDSDSWKNTLFSLHAGPRPCFNSSEACFETSSGHSASPGRWNGNFEDTFSPSLFGRLTAPFQSAHGVGRGGVGRGGWERRGRYVLIDVGRGRQVVGGGRGGVADPCAD